MINKKIKILAVILVLIATFLLVYSPHFNYHFPLHIDEWHAITEAKKIQNSEYIIQGRQGFVTQGFEIGFHLIIFILLKFVNPISFYQFLPAIWAVVSGIVLFYVAYRKTNNYYISFFSVVFFASIKSNVNITGLWFFTPLSFAIPFIFLFIYFFTEGMAKQNKKFILASVAIMLFLVPIHSVSVLFAIPILAVYSLFHLEYIKRQWKFFSIFLLIPLTGLIFYGYMEHLSFSNVFARLFQDLQFRKGWGGLEIKNSPLEIYSIIGYILALIGTAGIFLFEEKPKKYLIFLIWPAIVLISIAIFRITGVSYISPYQRNIYYLAISLPFLSAMGLFYLFNYLKTKAKYELKSQKVKKYLSFLSIIIFAVIVFFTFYHYFQIPKGLEPYHLIQEKDYQAILFLSKFPQSKVMSTAAISTAIYPISGHEPVGTIWFYGNKTLTQNFFSAKNCTLAQKILDENNVTYVLSQISSKCPWKLIYSKEDYIYKVR